MTTLEPPAGTRVRLACNSAEPPERLDAAEKAAWASFFEGASEPGTESVGWTMARNHKMVRESHVWTLEGYEDGPDGERWAVIMRTEPRCLDDVYNGTGTGLGTDVIRERIPV